MNRAFNISNLIEQKAEYWVMQEKKSSQSVIGTLIRHIEKTNKLREPQKKAIEVYLWLKFIGNNQKLSDIIKKGLLYDEEQAKQYDNFYTFGNNYITQFLNQFLQDNGVKNLHRKLVNDPNSQKINWEQVLDDLLYNYQYPNYLFSLPMGAGKTYLMACFIYLDLYFANLYKKDKRFAHNFIVLAPTASKTAILPSLRTIKNFTPEWILPNQEASKIKQITQIEILDALSSQRKDKLQGENPNLEKVNRLLQTKDFGLVFITNAEKVILEKYDEKDKIVVKNLKRGQKNLLSNKELSEIAKSNKLRERLSEIPFLTVILDEVHHTYKNKEEEKKSREAVNILNQNKNIVGVLGFSGTPYVSYSVDVENDKIKLNQIQDIVYNFPLNEGIGKFLKVPEVKSDNVAEKTFIKNALTDFFNDFDIKYPDGTKSKIAFYCPSIKNLNEKILPVVQEWYQRHRKNKENEIFRYYSKVGKENKPYEIPKENLALFHNLDKSYSDKRVILLVAVGIEGWDCKSLTAIALPRQKTTKNFVLQTTCRCLREVEDAEKEKALIYLAKSNYETLDKELGENYRLKISDLRFKQAEEIPVKIRKPKLGKLKYRQIGTRYKIVIEEEINYKNRLKNFNFGIFKNRYKFEEKIKKGTIGKEGLTKEIYAKKAYNDEILEYTFDDFIYDIANETFGKFSEVELMKKYPNELKHIFTAIEKNKGWISANPNLELKDIIHYIASLLMEEVSYKIETFTKDTEIELLEWNIISPTIGNLFKFMPKIESKNIINYQRHPEDLEADFLGKNDNIDPQDISFNYIPYGMDSNLEQNALSDMLKMSELAGLEVYFNGYQNEKLQSFYIQTPRGIYTPDFLIIKRKDNKKYQNKNKKGEIEKILILETKGKLYYNEEFRQKENFVKQDFIKYNPNFSYQCFVDKTGKNDFNDFINELKIKIKTL